jgi:hypothetical protein
MLLKKKNYETLKIKTYLKNEKLFFFFNGVNRSSEKLLHVEQELKTLGYCSYKVLNKITIKTLDNSIYLNTKPLFNGLNFFIKPFKKPYKLTKNIFQKSFEPLLFLIMAVKINDKVYSRDQLKALHSIKYNKNKLLFYQFIDTNLKNYYI